MDNLHGPDGGIAAAGAEGRPSEAVFVHFCDGRTYVRGRMVKGATDYSENLAKAEQGTVPCSAFAENEEKNGTGNRPLFH